LISKLNYDVSDELEVQIGIDWRTAGIEHAREVRDLLGGDYYVDYADDNAPDGKKVGLGDIIAYHNETTVDWFGTFLQGQYDTEKFNLYGMGGISTIAYTYQDHFSVEKEVVDADAITSFQVKGGGRYNLDDRLSAFANIGYVQKPPILDNVIDYDGNVSTDPDNEKFTSMEIGGEYNSDKVSVKGSYYNTQWQDRNLTKSVTTGQGSSGDTDINEEGQIIGQTSTEYEYALNNLKVGDMPQTSYVGGLTVKPIDGLRIQGLYKWYDNHYADWSPDSREVDGDADRAQVWKSPSYGKLDLHLSYKLPEIAGLDMTLSGHIFNVLDDVYIQDAVDNSKYNGYGDKVHAAHNAEVFLGTPRHFNVGLSVNF
jgi:iron complex outermembrane receptor protein